MTGGGSCAVAVVGAGGAVGRHAVGRLRDWRIGPLRLGGRVARGAGTTAVDVFDPASLAAFCAGAGIVVNCAGPARSVGARVAVAAHGAGAGYVDAAGDDRLLASVAAAVPGAGDGWRAVLSAGMMPGLSGLLPRLLAAEVSFRPAELLGYVGGRDRFTATAAADYLDAGAVDGEPKAAWRGGSRVSGALQPEAGAAVPFAPEPMLLHPYLSAETERVATELGLTEVSWYSVFGGEHVPAALGRGTERLRRAADLDLFGHDPYQLLVVQLAAAGGLPAATAVLRGAGASALTGTVAALAARATAEGRVPTGLHHAAEVLDPAWSAELLRDTPAVLELSVHQGTAAAAGSLQEGVL